MANIEVIRFLMYAPAYSNTQSLSTLLWQLSR